MEKRERVKGFAVWLGWAVFEAAVGGAIGIALVALYLRAS